MKTKRNPRGSILSLLLNGAAATVLSALLAASCLTPAATFDTTNAGGAGSVPEVAEHCSNRQQDQDETDLDCGGIDCEPCGAGRGCGVDSDCGELDCVDSTCRPASCTDQERNGDETDVDCGGSCLPCGEDKSCGADSDCESGVCSSGACAAPSCTDRVKNGAESDVDCGGPDCDLCDVGEACERSSDCADPPVGDLAQSLCRENICVLLCSEGRGDCNGTSVDGCEVSLNSDTEHCGACDTRCELPHVSESKCVAGECLIDKEVDGQGCVAPWLDCNEMPGDGCEANIESDAGNCGGCGLEFACSQNNGVATCADAQCTIECSEGFGDCDGDARSNGCEVDTKSNVAFCGGCELSENTCDPGNQSQSPNCVDGMCGLSSCPAGTGDCDGDGSCTDSLSTIDNCGACGVECSALNGATACVDQGAGNFACVIASCVDSGGADFENCDGRYDTGCRTDVSSTSEHCGACGNNCASFAADPARNIAAISCDDSSCQISACGSTFLDCDADPATGCEVESETDLVRCGGCLPSDPRAGSGATCANKPNAQASCSSGACDWTCNPGFGDVDGDLQSPVSNGCEVDIPNCFTPYSTSAMYIAGSKVSYQSKNWNCLRGECTLSQCRPGVSCAWGQTWSDLGICN